MLHSIIGKREKWGKEGGEEALKNFYVYELAE